MKSLPKFSLDEYWSEDLLFRNEVILKLITKDLFTLIFYSISFYSHKAYDSNLDLYYDSSFSSDEDVCNEERYYPFSQTNIEEQLDLTKEEYQHKMGRFVISLKKLNYVNMQTIFSYINKVCMIFQKNQEYMQNLQVLSIDQSVLPLHQFQPMMRVFPPDISTNRYLLFRKACNSENGYCLKIKLFVQNLYNSKTPLQLFKYLAGDFIHQIKTICTYEYFPTNDVINYCLENKVQFLGTIRKVEYQNTQLDKLQLNENRIIQQDVFSVQEWAVTKKKICSIAFTPNIQTLPQKASKRQQIKRPAYMETLNQYMQFPSLADYYLQTIQWVHRTTTWTTNLLFYLIDLQLVNCFYLVFNFNFQIVLYLVILFVETENQKMKFDSYVQQIAMQLIAEIHEEEEYSKDTEAESSNCENQSPIRCQCCGDIMDRNGEKSDDR